ncbi:hypothetical protein nvc1_140 [Namao virus]|nr:hypothetical protein nvc1_140 [Namao virus]
MGGTASAPPTPLPQSTEDKVNKCVDYFYVKGTGTYPSTDDTSKMCNEMYASNPNSKIEVQRRVCTPVYNSFIISECKDKFCPAYPKECQDSKMRYCRNMNYEQELCTNYYKSDKEAAKDRVFTLLQGRCNIPSDKQTEECKELYASATLDKEMNEPYRDKIMSKYCTSNIDSPLCTTWITSGTLEDQVKRRIAFIPLACTVPRLSQELTGEVTGTVTSKACLDLCKTNKNFGNGTVSSVCDNIMQSACSVVPSANTCSCINSFVFKTNEKLNQMYPGKNIGTLTPMCHDASCSLFGYKPSSMLLSGGTINCNTVLCLQELTNIAGNKITADNNNLNQNCSLSSSGDFKPPPPSPTPSPTPTPLPLPPTPTTVSSSTGIFSWFAGFDMTKIIIAILVIAVIAFVFVKRR